MHDDFDTFRQNLETMYHKNKCLIQNLYIINIYLEIFLYNTCIKQYITQIIVHLKLGLEDFDIPPWT